jgi:hypothetical protein
MSTHEPQFVLVLDIRLAQDQLRMPPGRELPRRSSNHIGSRESSPSSVSSASIGGRAHDCRQFVGDSCEHARWGQHADMRDAQRAIGTFGCLISVVRYCNSRCSHVPASHAASDHRRQRADAFPPHSDSTSQAALSPISPQNRPRTAYDHPPLRHRTAFYCPHPPGARSEPWRAVVVMASRRREMRRRPNHRLCLPMGGCGASWDGLEGG